MRVGIFGSGLSSLTLAQAFVNNKIYVDVIYKKLNSVIDKTRTIGISRSNVDYFNKNIININDIKWDLNKIEIFSDNLKNEKLINFEDNSKYLFSIIKNFKLYEKLENNLTKNKFFSKKYSKFNKNFCEKYDLVINTDYNNAITKKYFNKKIIKTYNSKAYTTIINHEKTLNNIAFQIFTKKGPLAFLPISKYETSVVFSAHNNTVKNIKNLNILIQKYNLKYKIKKIYNSKSFDLKGLSLRSYHHKNILAFGDLLHRIHPLAGQGFNMTVRDIINLTEIVRNKIDLGLPLDKSINLEFENNFRHKNLIFSHGIDLIHEFFNVERKTNSSLLSKSVQRIGKNQFINKIFTKIADKGLNY